MHDDLEMPALDAADIPRRHTGWWEKYVTDRAHTTPTWIKRAVQFVFAEDDWTMIPVMIWVFMPAISLAVIIGMLARGTPQELPFAAWAVMGWAVTRMCIAASRRPPVSAEALTQHAERARQRQRAFFEEHERRYEARTAEIIAERKAMQREMDRELYDEDERDIEQRRFH